MACFRPRAILVGVILLGFAAPGRANIVLDSGFESAAPSALAGGTTYYSAGSSIDGGTWNVSSGTVGVDTQNFYVYDGSKSLYLTGSGGSTIDSVSQTLTTVVGQTYTVSFYADADTNNQISVTLGGSAIAGLPTSVVQNGFPSEDYLGNSSLFVQYTGTVTATSTSTVLMFTGIALTGGLGGVTVEIDDVSVTPAAVPEPSTLVQLGIAGAIALCGSRLRRRRAIG